MIVLISKHVNSLQKKMIGKKFSSCLLSKDSLLIHGDYSFRNDDAEFTEIFEFLGISKKNEENLKDRQPYILTGKGIEKLTYIQLDDRFNNDNIQSVVNILVSIFDGYEVENYINSLKIEFDKLLNKEV